MEVSGQFHAPAALPPGKETLVPFGYEAGRAPEPTLNSVTNKTNEKRRNWFMSAINDYQDTGMHSHRKLFPPLIRFIAMDDSNKLILKLRSMQEEFKFGECLLRFCSQSFAFPTPL